MESLLATAEPISYARLAEWLVDAREQDIAAYWAGYRIGKQSNDITDLIFVNWTRLDPHAAIATGDPRAWWAWACHDPQAALAASITAGPERVNNVARG